MTIFYADVSHHDWNRRGGQLDWPAVRAATSPVVCIRTTYGDPAGWNRPSYHFLDMASAARAAGFTVIGGYHNLITGDAASMRRQVDWLRRQLDSVPGGAEWAMADVERYPELMSSGMYPRWADVLRFQDAWYAADERVMAWYLPQWVWSRTDMSPASPDLSRLLGPLVASRYPTTVDGGPSTVYQAAGGDSGPGWASYGGKRPDIWQFASSVNVSGASGNTDVNAYRGTLAQLTALLTQGEDMTVTDDDARKIAAAVLGYTDAGAKSFHDQFFGELVPAAKVAAGYGPTLTELLSKIDGLTRAVTALAEGGSSIDTAAVITAVNDRAAEDAARDSAQAQRIADLETTVTVLRARLADAAQAEAAALATTE